MNDTSIVNLLMDRVVETMTSEMTDLVADETEVGLFRSGKLQDDPTIAKINILVREGGDEWPDILVPAGYSLQAPQYQIGGGGIWLRRFYAEYKIFFVEDETRAEARRIAHVIFSRFRNKILTVSLNEMTDSFGEGALMSQVCQLNVREGGGPGSFIWRGEQYFEFMTETSL